MVDDHKYSIGRVVVYSHSDPKLPRQSYGHYGHTNTIGEITGVDLSSPPKPEWVYTIRNLANAEVTRVNESDIIGTTNKVKPTRKGKTGNKDKLLDLIAKVLSTPAKDSRLRDSFRQILDNERRAMKSAELRKSYGLQRGDYIKIRDTLRPEVKHVRGQYAKILTVQDSDVWEVPYFETEDVNISVPTELMLTVETPEQIIAKIYDVEIRSIYTAINRKVIFNWRAAMLLSEVFRDDPPYNLEFEYISYHIYTRDELLNTRKSELIKLLAGILYVKGKIGLSSYLHRSQVFAAMPKTHLMDDILKYSRFDSRRNRPMTPEEIADHRMQDFKLRRLLKNR